MADRTRAALSGALLVVIVFVPVTLLLSQSKVEINAAALKMFRPLPAVMDSAENPATPAKVKLGRMLYYEPRLSANQQISCNTCHPLDTYGAEHEAVSTGHKKQKGGRNAPTVYNAAGHFAQFWDGRAADVEEQAKGPVMNPIEMAMPSETRAIAVLKSMPEYVALFKEAFPNDNDPVTFDNMARAIAAFERGLVTPSRWDRFLAGDKAALTDSEKAGFNKFVATGCQSCHLGPYLGGSSFQKLGLAKEWPSKSDAGRYQVTKVEGDKMMFKVPSLRNISKTGPYFHDGSVPTLAEAIRKMAVYERGVELSDADVKAIATWLDTLTGNIPQNYIAKPALPKNTAQTPKAED